MTKNKHPHTRAERLAVKKIEFEKKARRHSGKVRRGLIDPIQDQETQDELSAYTGS